jgi:hypothetical protein
MFRFFYGKYTLSSQLPPAEIMARVIRFTEPKVNIRFPGSNTRTFEGEVTETTFDIRRILTKETRNFFRVGFLGQVSETPEGTRIEIRTVTPLIVKVLSTFFSFICGYLCWSVFVLIWQVLTGKNPAIRFFDVSQFVFLVLLGWIVMSTPIIERRSAKKFFLSQFEAVEI